MLHYKFKKVKESDDKTTIGKMLCALTNKTLKTNPDELQMFVVDITKSTSTADPDKKGVPAKYGGLTEVITLLQDAASLVNDDQRIRITRASRNDC